MELLPLAFTSGWTSGINADATVLLLGRFAGIEQVPTGLQRSDVPIIAAVLTVVEFAADKIAYVDSAWDTVSTLIRPVAGAAVLAAVLLVIGVVTALLVMARVRRGWRAFRRWRGRGADSAAVLW